MPRTSEPGRSVSSRLLQVLFAFQPEESDLSLAELERKTGLPHATVRRLVMELTNAGALNRRSDGRLTIGLRLWQLGTLVAVLEGQEAVVIDRLSAPKALGLVSQVGGRLPLHCSGVGKVLLSHAGDELVESVLCGQLRRYTPQTTIDPEALRRELAECRRTGTATVHEELTPGADSVAARIVDGEGRAVAALSVIVRSGSVKQQAALPSVIASGLGISRLLGWRPGIKIRQG